MRLSTFSPIVALAFSVHSLGEVGAQPDATSPIVKAAQSRQDLIKTVDVEFKLTETISKGGLSDTLALRGAAVPREETHLQSTNRLVIDGTKVRYEHNHPIMNLEHGKPFAKKYVSVFNGNLAKSFHPNGIGPDETTVGVIGSGPKIMDIKSYVLTPITLAFRGLDPAIAPFSIADFEPTGVTLPIDGAACCEYKFTPWKESVLTIWADPAKDHVVRRLRVEKNGRLAEQQDISYRRDDRWGWIPTTWVRNRYTANSQVGITSTVSVETIRLNESQPEELFELRFPEGTVVHDQRTTKDYLVKSNGNMHELSSRGEELPASVPQPGVSWFERNRWLLGSLVLILLTIGLGYITRRRWFRGV